MSPTENDFSAKLSAIKRNAKKITKPFEDLLRVKWSDKGSVESLSRIAKRMPPGSASGQAVEETRKGLEELVSEARRERQRSFKGFEATFIKGLDPSLSPRETANGWRIGPIEMELKRDEALARACYNHYPILPWTPVNSSEDLQNLLDKASGQLGKAKIPDERFQDALLSAYRFLRWDSKRNQLVSTEAVPIRDLYRELRVALTRFELMSKPGKKLSAVELPGWAFAYNLDLFVASGAKGNQWRMSLQTGSQAEQGRGRGITTNGLAPDREYKVYCYVKLQKIEA